ncbi:MAG: hypothetical protein DMG96_41385 [Acidobacteria bacterium]|nr:MAG: hypothetical protein DMG96_41385 [Acidobacteriota bacterium]
MHLFAALSVAAGEGLWLTRKTAVAFALVLRVDRLWADFSSDCACRTQFTDWFGSKTSSFSDGQTERFE